MAQRPRLLAIMGSGETAPTMAKVHRLLVERLGSPSVDAVLIDTPYGFQENAEQISRSTAEYFERTTGTRLGVAEWRSASDSILRREHALARIHDADYIFAGPGSPTYALQAWQGSGLRDVLTHKLARGGCIAFSSAAALTVGTAAVPVYEIYKAGSPPHWAEGMDLLATIGLRAAVIAHYDNAEGGTHDTRYCYLGERRLRLMEEMLSPGTVVVGVDEHTAAIFDLDAEVVTVVGRGCLTLRTQGVSTVFGSGTTLTLDELRTVAAGRSTASRVAPAPDSDRESSPPASLRSEANRLEQAFDAGLGRRDVRAAVAAILELEQAIVDWSADTEEEDGPEVPRAMLRRMVTRLGDHAETGARDPREHVAAVVDEVLDLRDKTRRDHEWAWADALRERLVAAGIEIRDTPEGTVWLLATAPAGDTRDIGDTGDTGDTDLRSRGSPVP